MSIKLKPIFDYIALRKMRFFVGGVIGLSILSLIDKWYFHSTLLILLWALVILLWVIFVTSLMTVAAFAILKPLIGISAGLTLLIFLSQTYCGLATITATGKTALLIVVLFGLIYLGYGFFNTLRKPIADITQLVKDNPVWEGYLSVGLLFITGGVFIWAIGMVVVPIVLNICAFK